MSEIESLGYVVATPTTKSYCDRPGALLPVHLLARGPSRLEHGRRSGPLASLRDEFGESAIMGVPANGTMVYLAFFPSVHLIMVRERLGTTRPMHCSALGKAYPLRARWPRARRRAGACSPTTAARACRARADGAARAAGGRRAPRGYAIDRDETFEGAHLRRRAGPHRRRARRCHRPVRPVEPHDEERIAEIGVRLVRGLAAALRDRRAMTTPPRSRQARRHVAGRRPRRHRDGGRAGEGARLRGAWRFMRTSSGPGLPGVPVFEAHAAAAGDVLRRAGLIVSTLNVVGRRDIRPVRRPGRAGSDRSPASPRTCAGPPRWARRGC